MNRARFECAAIAALMLGGCMTQSKGSAPVTNPSVPSSSAASRTWATVRYQVTDVERSATFYRQQLGFHIDQQTGAVFATVSRGNLQLLLSGPGSSGSRGLPDGRRQEPGGWNRIVLYVDDLPSLIKTLSTAGVRFRNQIEVGPGGKQIQIEDPDGNPIELHEAAK